MPLRPAEHPVGLLVVDDALALAVPSQFAAEQVGEVSQVVHVGHAVRDLDVHAGRFVLDDGLDPVFLVVHVVVAVLVHAVHLDAAGGDFEVAGLLLGGDPRAVAADDQRVSLAVEHHAEAAAAAHVARLLPDQLPIGVPERVDDPHRGRAVPDALVGRRAGGLDRDGNLAVGVHAPEDNAHDVGAAVADDAAAGFH